MEVNKTNRKGVYLGGKHVKFDLDEDSHFMEVTQWDNMDGYTISIVNHLGARTFEISFQELEGIKYLISRLENDD